MSKSALLVIDLQNEYLPTGKLPLVNIEQAAANAVKVIAKARQLGTQVIHVQHIADAESPIFEPSSNSIEFQDTVKPQEDEAVIIKNHINAFLNTNLKEILDSNQVTELVVIGAMSHMCVDAAVRAASDFGYKVKVIHDACATLDLEFNGVKVPAGHVHATLMAAFEFAYAQVISTEDYVSERLRFPKINIIHVIRILKMEHKAPFLLSFLIFMPVGITQYQYRQPLNP